MGFGIGFNLMFYAVFLLVIGVFAVVLVKTIGQWNRNNHSPRLTVPATIVAKRSSVTHHHHSAGDVHSGVHMTTSYYVTFQVESGDRMELSLSGAEYGMLAEGDRGQLTFQGTRFLSFARNR